MGALNDLSLWPWMMGRKRISVPDEEVIEETIRMFLKHYRAARTKKSPL
jgi:TetR/AcrR family transcriptional regulator of autoinduction and epiphytic fitness